MTLALGAAVLLAGAATVAATALLVALSLGGRSVAGTVLAVYVLGVAEVTALTVLLSLVGEVGRWQYLALQIALLAAAVWWWRRSGRPVPARPELGWLRRSPIVLALAAVVALAVAYEAFLVLTSPPNNWDSMTYHLPRAAEWYQRGGVQFLEDVHTERMNAFQPGAEIQVLYVFALARNDLLAELPQWLAQLALLAAVFGVARRACWGPAAAAFAALLTATLTQVALQSVTTQNDLVAAALAAAAAYFVLGRTQVEVGLAGLALGLALGTKLTVALALPALALLALAAGGVRRLVAAGAATALAFVVVGSYGFALNLVHTGSALGDAREVSALQPERTGGGTVSTVSRMLFRLVDLSGFDPPDGALEAIGDAGRSVFETLGIPQNPPESTQVPFEFSVRTEADEDSSYFGPLGLLLVALSAAFLVAYALRRAGRVRAALAATLPLYLVGLALAYRYNPWIGRFLATGVALTMPLAASVYRFRIAAAAVALVAASSLYAAHRHSTTHPTGADGAPTVWSLDRPAAIAYRFPVMTQTLAGVATLPEDATMIAVVGEDDFVYPLYGPELKRRVHTITGADYGSDPWPYLLRRAREVGAGFLLHNGSLPEAAPGWEPLVRYPDNGWVLLRPR